MGKVILETKPHLEQILLITKRFLLLLPQLVETVIMSIVIDKFMISFRDGFPYLLADLGEVFTRLNDSRIDEFKFGRKCFCEHSNVSQMSRIDRKVTPCVKDDAWPTRGYGVQRKAIEKSRLKPSSI